MLESSSRLYLIKDETVQKGMLSKARNLKSKNSSEVEERRSIEYKTNTDLGKMDIVRALSIHRAGLDKAGQSCLHFEQSADIWDKPQTGLTIPFQILWLKWSDLIVHLTFEEEEGW